MNDNDSSNEARRGFLATITCSSGTAADRRNQYVFTAWCLLWALSFVGASWLLKGDEPATGLLKWIAVLVPSFLALGSLASYLGFLKNADDLLRQIQLQGLAIGFGVGVFFGIGYQLAEMIGAPELEISTLVAIMLVGWSVGQLAASRRYR